MEENEPGTRNPNHNPNSAAKDRVAGNVEHAKGRAKESFGALTGNEHVEAEGRHDQVSGAARNKKGLWKERIKAWIDRI